MELNIETKQQLETLLAKPALVTQEHIPLLQNLIKRFPYYQPLHLLMAKACMETEYQQTLFTNAAMYTNGNILHQLIHEPETLVAKKNINVVLYDAWSEKPEKSFVKNIITQVVVKDIDTHKVEQINNSSSEVEALLEENLESNQEVEAIGVDAEQSTVTTFHPATMEEVIMPVDAPEIENLAGEEEESAESVADEVDHSEDSGEVEVCETVKTKTPPHPFAAPVIENLPPLREETFGFVAEEVGSEVEDEQNTASPEKGAEIHEVIVQTRNEPFVLPEIENLAPLQSELSKVGLATGVKTEGIDDIFDVVANESIATPIAANIGKADEVQTPAPEESKARLEAGQDVIQDSSFIESVASVDFFAFESNFKTELNNETSESVQRQMQLAKADRSDEQTDQATDHVSKYDDDKLPFTFLWWLAKTRKDHEETFQPFVSVVKPSPTSSDLQQQYVEHIFHQQSPFDGNLEEITTAKPQRIHSNENMLVEKFIKNDPQLKVPKPEQINNENKAKKSAEDKYDVVSETLAEIYIEQMLYHKAIDTYQKLSLKFPEKSRYFADLILSLEKKN